MIDMGSSFLACVERDPSKLAIVDGEQRFSYEEWMLKVLSLVAGLDDIGLSKGDHVISVMQNRLEAATLHWACQLAGLIITPLNWRIRSDELDYALKNADGRAVFFEDTTAQVISKSALAEKLPKISADSGTDATLSLDALFDLPPVSPVSRAHETDTSVMLYTSGTTGPGKGVPRSHRAERAASVAHIAQNGYGRAETTLGVMPLYHTMGIRSLLSMCLINGTFVCQRRFTAPGALSLLADEKITNLYLVPTLYHDLIHSSDFESSDISSVRKLGYAGANMTDGLLLRLNDLFQPELFVNHYGSSEIYTFTVEADAVSKPGSAGKAGLNQRIRVVSLGSDDPDELAGAGQEGQIVASLQSDEAFQGYWNRPEADQKSLRSGWYFTGDIGYFDEDRDLFVTGRVDDMIISGGENILPAESESVLSLHNAVGEVAVVGLPHERLGQQVTAFVQCDRSVTTEELDQWCINSKLAPFKRPREYVFVAEIPKSPVGKILRRKLLAGDYEIKN